MSDQWFYRVFGEEFGPMPLEKLRELAESGTVQALDDVRTGSGDWMAAANVEELGLSTSERRTVATMTTPSTDFDIVTSTVSDEWFCQVAGAELGPLGFDELLKFAEHEQLDADDQVKLGVNGKWRRAGSIGRLMAALPYKASEKTIVPRSSRPASIRPSDAVAAPREARIADVEDAEDDVVLPENTIAAPVAPAATVSAPDMEAAYRVAYEQAAAKVAESMIAQADAVYKAAEEQAQALIAWAKKPDVDRFWWGWANGVEFGPVEFSQVFGLAKSGQLKPSDLVRNGQYGQYTPSSNLPGLFNALTMIVRAAETRNLAKSQAQAAASMVAAPTVIPAVQIKAAEKAAAAPLAAVPAKSNPSIGTPKGSSKSDPEMTIARVRSRTDSDPQVATRNSIPTESERPAPTVAPAVESGRSSFSTNYSSSSSGFSSSSSAMSSYGSSRPAAVPNRPSPRRAAVSESTWFSDMLENLKEPKAIGSICAIALVLLIVGWGYLPKSRSADLKRYHALKELVDEISKKRASAPAELAALQQKLTKVAKEVANEVKAKASREDLAKQNLLWASRDEVPRVIAAGLSTESAAEKNLVLKLKEVAYELGLEKRPPVDLAMIAARANDD